MTRVSYYFEETLMAINILIDRKDSQVSVKKIRKILNIENSDRSKISFIWRILDDLEQAGYLIKTIEKKGSYRYKLPKKRIKTIKRQECEI